MKVVIVGAGAVGFQLAKQLISEKKDVVLIEKNPDAANRVSNALDCMVVTGEGTNREILRRAGTATADYFVAATDSDEVNMIACGIVSSEFQVKAKIARVRSFDYHSGKLSEKRFLGIDFVVNPEIEAARAIIRAVDFGAVSDIMAFEQSRVQIRNIVVERDGPLSGRTLEKLSEVLPGSFLIAVVVRENRYLIPSGTTRLQGGDILYIVANEGDFDAIFDSLGKSRGELKKVILVGGGRIGRQVAEYLLTGPPQSLFRRVSRRLTGHNERQVKIVERDYQRCKALIEEFPRALVINADISDDGVFEEQHFANADLVIAATDNQELNIVTALYAKSQGIRRSVVLVNRASYAPIAAQLGIDVPVSQKNAIVTTILRFIRSGAVRSIHTISDGRVEVLELTVLPNSRAVGTAIKDLQLPRDTLIVAMEREGMSLVPGGNNVVRANDQLVVIAKKEHGERVQELFSR
ncbi:MAG: Trk system potassium transporter TrkA [Alkalispirochaeta sp.]